MHHVLTESLQRLQNRLMLDERCLGLYLWGSLANNTADEWSDVDVVAVIRDDDYAAVKAEFRAICEEACGRILVWLPEGESAAFVNFAFLFEVEDRLHLYDFSLENLSHLQQSPRLKPEHILYDRSGALAEVTGRATVQAQALQPDELCHQIDIYWVYTYLNGKYYQRRDTYKMLYVQQVIFQTHMNVLHFLYPDAAWHWWARDVHTLPVEQQQELMVYFSAAQATEIAHALEREMDLFSRDARRVCAEWRIPYQAELEKGVRAHLQTMGLWHQ
ncbi:MAG: nucleotidyltransferase domain-containing protein [Chloroflexi bacterium]|nr:nucleotidyltransferase domain-containing protein [Chloroflexota bacterium]